MLRDALKKQKHRERLHTSHNNNAQTVLALYR